MSLSTPTIAVAESITGGLLASSFIEESGASSYFKGGIIAYSPEIKTALLGVKLKDVQRDYGVNEETAKSMALGIARLMRADIGISTTGFAEPYDGHDAQAYIGICKVGSGEGEIPTMQIIHIINPGTGRNEFRAHIVEIIRSFLCNYTFSQKFTS